MQRLKHLAIDDFHLMTDAQLGRLAHVETLETPRVRYADKIGARGILQLAGLKNLRACVSMWVPLAGASG